MFQRFEQYAERVRPGLDAAFELTLARLLEGAGPFGFSGSLAPLTSGKKLRGILLCMVAETLGGDVADALHRAVAVEMIQTASLVHDDFVDQHRYRRNRPSLWSVEGGRRAVLVGDVIFASAIRMMSELGPAECRIASGAIAEVALGAYQEPPDPAWLLRALERGLVTGEVYGTIIRLKTAILFGAACELGALSAGAAEDLAALWRNYGVKVGESYQIADDLQEVEGALERGGLEGEELSALAPALLYFEPGILPHLVRGVRCGELAVVGEVREIFRGAAQKMREERERRLQEAVAWVSQDLPGHLLGSLALRAPWELISLFDAASSAPCAP